MHGKTKIIKFKFKLILKIIKRCTCGKSVKQPFCDGSHRGTEFRPFIFEGCGSQVLCVCKKTNIKPFCDNTHEKLMDKLIN